MTEKLPAGHVRTFFKEGPKPHVSAQKRREGNSEAHLVLVRQLSCCVCGKPGPSDPHHLKTGEAAKERAVGRRATDQRTVPLCRVHHEEIERAGTRGEVAQFLSWGIENIHALAKALWKAPRDVHTMQKIVLAHRWGLS